MKKQNPQKVQPTYVLISPYPGQNNTVELVAKFGSLFVAAISLTCMILFHQKTNDDFWVLFLPQFVFFSLTFIIGCISNNKTFQLIQIVITYIFIDYSYYLACLTARNFAPNNIMTFPVLFLSASLFLYAIAAQLNHREHYVTDLSTPESVSSLNKMDFCHILFFIVSLCFALPLAVLLESQFPFWVYTQPKSEKYESCLTSFVGRCLALYEIFAFVCSTGYLLFTYYRVNSWNNTKTMACLRNVSIDSDGRAWFSMTAQVPLAFSHFKSRCLSIFCGCTSKLTGRNQSSVKPEDSQKLPLNALADLNV
uniref:MARVEL domain-containing protein n=1 Tax=Panagrellus redivivus TaxID=6233 RepID=A0A7E4UNP5_PANRE